MALSPIQKANLIFAADAALQTEAKYRMPSKLTVAQWAQESGWGKYAPGNNCFGIKEYAGCYGKQVLITHEFVRGVQTQMPQSFATFATLADCFDYHARLLTNLTGTYGLAWADFLEKGDLEAYVRRIASRYSTDPNYAATILSIMKRPDVNQAIAEVKAHAKREYEQQQQMAHANPSAAAEPKVTS